MALEAGKVVTGLGVYFDLIQLYVSFLFDIYISSCMCYMYVS